LRREPWVELIEDAPDLEPYYRTARCVVLPIRSGGGSRLKVFEALAYGVPIVGTSRAVAGIPIGDGAIVRADDTEGLVSGAVAVLSDDDVAGRLGSMGRAVFLERLSWSQAAKPLLELLAELGDRS
jgi:glycosyltransferase involved in cell wall biosynthesis